MYITKKNQDTCDFFMASPTFPEKARVLNIAKDKEDYLSLVTGLLLDAPKLFKRHQKRVNKP